MAINVFLAPTNLIESEQYKMEIRSGYLMLNLVQKVVLLCLMIFLTPLVPAKPIADTLSSLATSTPVTTNALDTTQSAVMPSQPAILVQLTLEHILVIAALVIFAIIFAYLVLRKQRSKSANDVTKLLETQKALTLAKERFELTIDGSGDGLWENDLVNQINWWSPRLYEMYGYQNKEVDIDFAFFVNSIHPDDKDKVLTCFEQHLSQGSDYDITYRSVRKDGSIFWSRARGKTLRADDGTPLKSAGSVVDITELIETQQALTLTKDRFELTIDGSGDGLWIADFDNESAWWSPLMYKLHGYQSQEIEATFDLWVSHLHPDDRDNVLNSFQEHLDTNCNYEVVYRAFRKDGSMFWARSRGVTLRDQKGIPLKSAGSITDVTELIKTQEALASAKERLELTTEGSGDGLWIEDLMANTSWWSPRLYGMYGYENQEQPTNLDFWIAHIHPDDSDYALSSFQKHLDTGCDYDVIYRGIRKDGSIIWTRDRCITQRDDNGKPLQSAGSVTNITETN